MACFVLWPLRFSFEKPETDGVWGVMFDALGAFDKPFNQAPSLHIALLVILWVCYARHVQGLWRWLLHGWFALIGVSVLTTWQHHFIDLPTGALLGWLCVWLWPQQGPSPLRQARLAVSPERWRLALRYALLGIVAVALVIGGYAAARVAVPRTGTLEVAAVGDPGALVRVDGVLRGNPPLIASSRRFDGGSLSRSLRLARVPPCLVRRRSGG